ncbi:MAG: phage holin [Clostridia bacterium]|nr:phage holin [Clostridia bacterium]
MKNQISNGTIARTVVLVFALVNQVLTICGWNPLPFSEEGVYEGISLLLTVGASLLAWWKNNSFTPAAIAADKMKDELKAGERK